MILRGCRWPGLPAFVLGVATLLVACSSPSTGGQSVIAADGFSRTVPAGLGTADMGGAWTQDSLKNATAMVNGTAVIITFIAPRPVAYYALREVSSLDQDIELTFAIDQFVVGATLFLEVDGRRVGADNTYYLLVRVHQDFGISLELRRDLGGKLSALAPEAASTEEHVDYTVHRLRYQITGRDPTTIRARIWADGAAEPEAWLVTATDSSAVLQAAGYLEFGVYSTAELAKTPLSWTIDNFNVRATSPAASSAPDS